MAVAWLLRPFTLCLFLLTLSPFSYSISESEALLNFKKSLQNTKALDSSWQPGTSPCEKDRSWNGIICQKGTVSSIQLEKMELSGNIDVVALKEISGLRSVSIMNNSFSGTIPEFNRLGVLKNLYLSGNKFTGEIASDYFSNMYSMKKVWLSNNEFTGSLPSSLAKVPNLMELRAENNQFSGGIPPFRQQTLTDINFSNNKLEGQIPPGLSKFSGNYFAGNPSLCGEKVGKVCEPKTDSPSPDSSDDGLYVDKDDKKKYIAAFVTLGVMLLCIVIFFIYKQKKKNQSSTVLGKENSQGGGGGEEEGVVQVQVSAPQIGETMETTRKSGSRRANRRGSGSCGGGLGEIVMINEELGVFGLPDLMKAAAQVLGNGGLGSSYKAVMANGVAVVVKRMRDMNVFGKDEFDEEMKKLGKLKHANILTPLAYHFRKDEKLLVYEYKPKGSLLSMLHSDQGPSRAELDWLARLRIVRGISEGLKYLQKEFPSADLPHGNLKSSNVLLNDNNEALLSDYGFNPLTKSNNVAEILFAYRAPEVENSLKVSPKCDVYCLGIIILEILTGKFPSQYFNNTKGGIDVVEWVSSSIAEGKGDELYDPQLIPPSSTNNNMQIEIEKLLRIGAACTVSNPDQRLDMNEAISKIEEINLEGFGDGLVSQSVSPDHRETNSFEGTSGHNSNSSSDGYSLTIS